MGVMFTNLAIAWGLHIVQFYSAVIFMGTQPRPNSGDPIRKGV